MYFKALTQLYEMSSPKYIGQAWRLRPKEKIQCFSWILKGTCFEQKDSQTWAEMIVQLVKHFCLGSTGTSVWSPEPTLNGLGMVVGLPAILELVMQWQETPFKFQATQPSLFGKWEDMVQKLKSAGTLSTLARGLMWCHLVDFWEIP